MGETWTELLKAWNNYEWFTDLRPFVLVLWMNIWVIPHIMVAIEKTEAEHRQIAQNNLAYLTCLIYCVLFYYVGLDIVVYGLICSLTVRNVAVNLAGSYPIWRIRKTWLNNKLLKDSEVTTSIWILFRMLIAVMATVGLIVMYVIQ